MAERAAEICEELSRHLKRMVLSKLAGRGISTANLSLDRLPDLLTSPLLTEEEKESISITLETNVEKLLKGIHVLHDYFNLC